MKRIATDIYLLIFKLTNSEIITTLITIIIATFFSFICLHGLILVFEGLFKPIKFLEILYKGKIQYATLTLLLLLIARITLKINKSGTNINRKPDYLLLAFFLFITIILFLYIKYSRYFY